ncbi:MAG: DUF418 domain-containing protein [Ferruginibacter sp.]
MQTLSPVKAAEREIFMDVLRGFAILGIFIANLGSGFSWYRESAHLTGPMLLPELDHKMSFLHHMFIEGKFYSIFSLLFGWGIALQVKRGLAKGVDALPTIKRRLVFMLLLGAIHLLIWPGDIVFFYALLGFLLLPFRKFSDKTLLITGIILILIPILLYAAKMKWPFLNAPAGILYETGEKVDSLLNGNKSEADFQNMLAHGSWWDILKGDIAGFFFRYGYLFFVSRIPKVLGMFLIGYVVGRSDFYKNIAQHKKLLYYVIGFGLVVGLPANYWLAHYMSWYEGDYFSLKMNGFYETLAYALGVVPLAMTYVAVFMLSFKTGAGKKILSVLAPVGKMAFSNYILQSLTGNFVFLGAGLGYMGQVGPVYFTLFGIIFFILQVIISATWLKYFNYGPLEWLWRSATYKKWQPMRKTTLQAE